MNKNIRIIARLDIKGPNVVKGIHLEGLRVVGRPELFADLYYKNGVDELIYIDSVASLYGRNSLEEIVKRTAEKIFVPLTVGGGIRTVDDVKRLLRAGAEKIALNTAAIKNPQLIGDIAKVFGSQCIVISIQAVKRSEGKYECLTDNARETTGKDVFDWVKEVSQFGVGEILLSSVDQEGTGGGFDLDLIQKVSEMVSIPVVAHGGAGCLEHFKDVILKGKADAICAASVFHYALVEYMSKNNNYLEEGNIDFLKQALPLLGLTRRNINSLTVNQVKQYLLQEGIACRLQQDSPKGVVL